jgi:hypothetical protein
MSGCHGLHQLALGASWTWNDCDESTFIHPATPLIHPATPLIHPCQLRLFHGKMRQNHGKNAAKSRLKPGKNAARSRRNYGKIQAELRRNCVGTKKTHLPYFCRIFNTFCKSEFVAVQYFGKLLDEIFF